MPCKRTTATSIRAVLLLGVFVATPAFAVTADLTVTATGPYSKTSATETSPLSYTTSQGTPTAAVYKISVANAGPNHAEGVTLNVTLPDLLQGTDVTVDNCTPVVADQAGPFPCTVVTDAGSGVIIDGASVDLVVSTYVHKMAATCVATLDPTVVTVSSTSTDPAPGNNTAQVTNAIDPFAAIETTVTGPASANVGDTITYTVTAKNVSPCPAANVGYTSDVNYNGVVNPMLTFVSDSVNSPDDGSSDGTFMKFADSLAPGASASVDIKYKIGPLPSEVNATTYNLPQTFAVSGDAPNGNVDPFTAVDANGANAASATIPIVANKSSGCNSTGSAGGLLSLALMGLAAWRRRKA